MKKLLILGRETNLCQAEVETVFDEGAFLAEDICLVKSSQVDINQLGGVIKVVKPIADVEMAKINQKLDQIKNIITSFITDINPAKKVSFGFSFYGDGVTGRLRQIGKIGIEQKNILHELGIKSRYIKPKTGLKLSSAQVIHNQLCGQKAKGFDFCVVLIGSRLIIGYTTAVQDITSYSRRDRDRPCRNMVVGMLPPKLAQIMLNLAKPVESHTIVDPFCGSGVILQEALIAGFNTQGSDLSDKMIACSQKNLSWLNKNYSLKTKYSLSLADATQLKTLPANNVIVTEGFLGRPFGTKPGKNQLSEQTMSLTEIYLNFFQNLKQINNPPTRIVICLPLWRLDGKILRLDIIDQIISLGYTLEQFVGLDPRQLIYLRENQIVGRQVLVLTQNTRRKDVKN